MPQRRQYSLENGGMSVSPRRIKFERVEGSPGLFRIMIDGKEVTSDQVRGCLFPSCVDTPTLKVGVLFRRGKSGRELTVFHNGKVEAWTSEDLGLPKIEVTGTAVKCQVGNQSLEFPTEAVT